MRILTLLLVPLLSQLCIGHLAAQKLTVGATGATGTSRIIADDNSSLPTKQRFPISGNAGITVEWKLGAESSLGMEALWVPIRSSEILENFEFVLSPVESIFITEEYWRHFNYVGIPVYHRLALGKIGIKTGFQAMWLVNGHFTSESIVTRAGLTTEDGYRDDNTDHLDQFDYGPKLGLDYAILPELRVRADFYYGLNDLLNNIGVFKFKNRQLTAGISYRLPLKRKAPAQQ